MASKEITVEIRADAALEASERGLFVQWTQTIFGAEEEKYEWAVQDWHVLVYCQGELACHAGITQRTASAGGKPVNVGGIGGVMTPKAWRGRGLATEAMEAAVRFMHERADFDFGLLLCSPKLIPFYEKLGWVQLHEPLRFAQPSGAVEWDEVAMVIDCGEFPWPGGEVDLCGLPW